MTNTKKYFITATDTDAGKTLIASALIRKFTEAGNKVAAYKPISAGCELINGNLVNEDAQSLLAQANTGQSLAQVNPIAFKEPIAPHIAADKYNRVITTAELISHYSLLERSAADVIVTEGAGGWRLPLGSGNYLSELPQKLNMDVILVVNMKLGCLNHALLTTEAIKNDGLKIVGWVANCPEEMTYLDENIATLKSLIDAPMLGQVPFCHSVSDACQYIDLTSL